MTDTTAEESADQQTDTPTDEMATEQSGEQTSRKKATFNTLTVSNVRPLTSNAVEVTFTVPEELVDDYNYQPGQYVALRATIDGEELRRSYSLCTEPRRGEIRIGIKKDFGGVFSTWANEQLKAGDTLEVMNPQGAFTSRHNVFGLNDATAVAEQAKETPGFHLAAIAAGSGITPIIAIVRAVLHSGPDTQVDLVYANRSAQDVMFAEEIGDLKDRYPSRFAVHHVLSREQRVNPLLTGRIDDDKLEQILENVIRTAEIDEWFLCGPFELVQLSRDSLKKQRVKESDIRFELFSTGKPEEERGNIGRPVQVDPGGDNITISFQLDGASGEVQSPRAANETVLNAALRVRPDVPFACAGGVCGTCRAKVLEGEFDMAENFALEKDEIDRGYVLTCQTHATGDKLVVDYDA